MAQFSTAVDSDFARLHGFDSETLDLLINLIPHHVTKISAPSLSMQSLPSESRSAPVQDCYKLRYEAAEKRYARMKGIVSASLEAQRMVKLENECLKTTREVRRTGMECPVALDAMVSVGDGRMSVSRSGAIASEVQSLASRLNSALDLNEKLMQYNRVMRGEQAPMCHSDGSDYELDLRQRIDVLSIESAVQRRRITDLELECTRLQSDQNAFEHDERLRECEDVFDKILGRDRLDFGVESIPGAVLAVFHPIGTCRNNDCQAYAKRLRGGLRKAVTAEYVRERNERLHGLVKCGAMPLETLRVEKDAVIEKLQRRICCFEQAMRMTSEEADQIELRSVTSKIFVAAKDLEQLESKSADARKEYMKWGVMLSNRKAEFDEIALDLADARREDIVLGEEKTLIEHSRNLLAKEYAVAVSFRKEIAQFRDGRMGAVFREQKAQLEAVQREMEGMRMERNDRVDHNSMAVETGSFLFQQLGELEEPPLVSGHKKAKRAAQSFDVVPGVGLRMLCRCGQYVPFTQIMEHAQEVHSIGSRRILICGAGCGHFVINGSRSDVDKHANSRTCRQRLAEIHGLVAGAGGV